MAHYGNERDRKGARVAATGTLKKPTQSDALTFNQKRKNGVVIWVTAELARTCVMAWSEQPMRTYEQAVELANICARQARLTINRRVAEELWRMAKEYQADAAKLDEGKHPDIGEPPLWAV